jgi:hypothetical protein
MNFDSRPITGALHGKRSPFFRKQLLLINLHLSVVYMASTLFLTHNSPLSHINKNSNSSPAVKFDVIWYCSQAHYKNYLTFDGTDADCQTMVPTCYYPDQN